MISRKEYELSGKKYIWTGKNWCEKPGYIIAPLEITKKLDILLNENINEEDMKNMDNKEMIQQISIFNNSGNYKMALELCNKLLERDNLNDAAIACRCSVLRKYNRYEEAIALTAPHIRNTKSQAMLTTYASALCDAGRWQEAKQVVGRALAIGGNDMNYAVVNRIKANRPDLY